MYSYSLLINFSKKLSTSLLCLQKFMEQLLSDIRTSHVGTVLTPTKINTDNLISPSVDKTQTTSLQPSTTVYSQDQEVLVKLAVANKNFLFRTKNTFKTFCFNKFKIYIYYHFKLQFAPHSDLTASWSYNNFSHYVIFFIQYFKSREIYTYAFLTKHVQYINNSSIQKL